MSKRVLVTGSGRGIGKAIALELGRAGFEVVLHYRVNLTEAQRTKEELKEFNPNVRLLCFDVSDRATTKAALMEEVAEHGAFWGVVCNAGITRDGPFPGLEDEDWDVVMRTNLDSFYNVLSPLTMPMIKLRAGGRIVVISSLSGLVGNRGQVNYSASKAGLIGAAKALSKELAKRNITVNCVAPGLIESDMTENNVPAEIIEAIPMKRVGRPEEVAGAVAYLMSENAGYVTGQTISINGGIV